MKRTASIGSCVGPAVTRSRTPKPPPRSTPLGSGVGDEEWGMFIGGGFGQQQFETSTTTATAHAHTPTQPGQHAERARHTPSMNLRHVQQSTTHSQHRWTRTPAPMPRQTLESFPKHPMPHAPAYSASIPASAATDDHRNAETSAKQTTNDRKPPTPHPSTRPTINQRTKPRNASIGKNQATGAMSQRTPAAIVEGGSGRMAC